MMRRKANLLLSVTATMLAVSGCSPFHSKLHRQASHEVADPAAITEAETSAGSRFEMPSLALPKRAAAKPKVADEKVQQMTAVARLSERRGEGEQAERIYRKLIQHDPNSPLPYHRLGIMKAKQSLFDEAEQLLSQAYKLNPTDPKLLNDIGYLYYLTSDTEKAEEFYRYTLRFDPNHNSCCNNLGILLGEQGRYDEAEQLFRRGCKDRAKVESNMAFVYAQRGELSRAVDAYSRALTIDNTLKPAAQGLLNLGRMQDRIASTRNGLANRPERVDYPRPNQADVADGDLRRATRRPAADQLEPAAIAYGGDTEVEANRVAAIESQPNPASRKGLLSSLSDFATSLSSPIDQQPASEANTDSQVAARADEDSPTPVDEAQRKMAVRALFTVAGDEDGQQHLAPGPGEEDPAESGTTAKVQPRTAEAPATPEAPANVPKAAVTVRISDLTGEAPVETEKPDQGESDKEVRSSNRRVSPASYAPSKQEANLGEMSHLFSAATADHRETLNTAGDPAPSAGTAPSDDEAMQDFLDTWLDLKQPQAGSPSDTHSSRRVQR